MSGNGVSGMSRTCCTPRTSAPPLPLRTLLAATDVRRAADLDTGLDALPTGIAPLDAALGGGFALRRTHLLTGTRGSGAASLLHLLLAAVTPDAPAFLLDGTRRFFPPAAVAAGVHLPHLLLVQTDDPRRAERALAAALRSGACPLVVWDVGHLLPPALLERFRPRAHGGGGAFLLVAAEHAPAGSPADGATLAVAHARWGHRADHAECRGRDLTVTVTNHRTRRVTAVPLAVAFPRPLPPLVGLARKGGGADASASDRGSVGAGVAAASRRAG